jgi:preprotein translocase subunit Sec63
LETSQILKQFELLGELKIQTMAAVSGNSDYYKILQIDRTASGDDIKKAYRNLALKVGFQATVLKTRNLIS